MKLKFVQRQLLLSQLHSMKQARVKGTTCVLSALAITNVEGEYLEDIPKNLTFNVAQSMIALFFSKEEHHELFSHLEQLSDQRFHIPANRLSPGLEHMAAIM